ncbi:hypothetical protein EDD11_002161 [Mortierella claussenii]|nr:hypothetical protein EDD11_002161 [Mortierella claussenii]
MPIIPIQPALYSSSSRANYNNFTTSYSHNHPMDLQYQYPTAAATSGPYYAQQPHTQQQQQPYDHYSYSHDGHDGRNHYDHSHQYQYNSNYHHNDADTCNISSSSSKNTSPAPFSKTGANNEASADNNDLDAANESQAPKTHKGKIFQCTGFGDCRMVFTRSEHLARHARKHTGEKPFQCVVEGCNRMFSRFDNMVQHTQTHTKGAERETTEVIANKIAIESRRKSEAGLLGGGTVRRASIKGAKAKRSSISSGSGSESPQKGRHERIQSMPMLNMTAASPQNQRATTPVLPSPVTPSSSSPLAPKNQQLQRQRSKTLSKDTGKIRKRQGSIRDRRGSLESSVHHLPSESWYASKLHHRPSLDFGLDQHAFIANAKNRHDVSGMETQPRPVSHYTTDQAQHRLSTYAIAQHQSSSFSRLRHPLSPEHSSHSDDIDSDDGSVHSFHNNNTSSGARYRHHRKQHSLDEYLIPSTARSRDAYSPAIAHSMDDCKLPPLRTSLFLPEIKPRLPSLSFGRIRSQSITNDGAVKSNFLSEPYAATKTRRLSLVELNAPIQAASMAVHHSMQAPVQTSSAAAVAGGVDVSEDEIKALEAFGELWSQGRDVEMTSSPVSMTESTATAAAVAAGAANEQQRRSTTPRIKREFAPYEAPVPGPDSGRRGVFGEDDNAYQHYRPNRAMTMQLD